MIFPYRDSRNSSESAWSLSQYFCSLYNNLTSTTTRFGKPMANSCFSSCPSPKPDLGDSVDFLTSGFTLLGMSTLLSVYACLRAMLKERRDLALENLALHQQLAVVKRSQRRLKIKQRDRLFWLALTNLVWLARSAGHRKTCHRRRLAS